MHQHAICWAIIVVLVIVVLYLGYRKWCEGGDEMGDTRHTWMRAHRVRLCRKPKPSSP